MHDIKNEFFLFDDKEERTTIVFQSCHGKQIETILPPAPCDGGQRRRRLSSVPAGDPGCRRAVGRRGQRRGRARRLSGHRRAAPGPAGGAAADVAVLELRAGPEENRRMAMAPLIEESFPLLRCLIARVTCLIFR